MAVTSYITITQGSQDIANNKTYVTVEFYAKTTNNSYNGNSKSGSLTINGTAYSFTHNLPKTSTTLLKSVSLWISHDSNGKGSVSASGWYVTGTGSGTVSASKSLTLTTIPRVSDLSVNKTSVPADGSTTVTATATKKSSSFTDTLTVTLGSYSKTITSGTAFTIPMEWINAISGTSATATVKVTTKSGSTTIGSKSASLTVTVPNSVVPTVNSISATEAITAVTTAFGSRFVKSLSQLNVKVDASGVYGSTIKSYAVTLGGVKYTSAEFQSNALNTAGSVNIVATVTDSRGRTGTLTKTITVVDYSAPAITGMTYYPCDASGNRDSNGTNTKVIVSGVVSSVESQNSKALTLKYKLSSGETYTAVTMTVSDWSFESSVIINDTDSTQTYEYVAELADKISSISHKTLTGVPVISRHAGGDGVTFFGEAEDEGLKVAGGKNATFTGDIFIENSELETLWTSVFGTGGVAPKLIDYIYPLGTVLTFTKDVDPNDIYAHQTWERFAKGKTLVGVDEDDTDFASVGNTGGEKTHKLVESEMPSHWHFVVDNGNTGAVYTSSKSLNSSSSTSAPNYATRLTKTSSGYTKAGDNDTFRLITASAGSGTAHNNLQPYETVYYWKRTA